MLLINDITVRVAGKLLLDGASATIPAGARVGLVGRNGVGKTTLFRAIAGDVALEHGDIALPPRARIGRLSQEAPDGPEPLLEVVLAADAERTAANGWCSCMSPKCRPRTTTPSRCCGPR